jgi:carbamoyl-phosphate synthase large subunit
MVYIIEANTRARRTAPFVSKAIGVPLAKVATWIMHGAKLKDFNLTKEINIDHVAVKESVFPFLKLPESDTILGPEMKSTGESIGIDENFGMAFYKSQLSAGMELPKEGKIFLTVKEQDKKKIRPIADKAANLGFEIAATNGTGKATGLEDIEIIKKVSQGSPNIRDAILNNEIDLIINTSEGKQSAKDGYIIRRLAIELGIPYVTTLAGARAALNAIAAVQNSEINVKSLNDYADGE